MTKDIKKYSLKSDAFYKSITRVTFTPTEEYTKYEVVHKKGDIEYKCNLFTLYEKKVKKVYTDSIIKVNHGTYFEELVSMEDFVSRYPQTYFLKDDKIYIKAEVFIETNVKDANRCIRFDNNEEAINYMETLKQNCKTFGNVLI